VTTVIMVCGDPNYRGDVEGQLASMVNFYKRDVVLITFCGVGPSWQASGWAIKNGVYFAELPNLRKRYRAKHNALAAAAALALGPSVCVTFGPSPEAEAAGAAGIQIYEL
jgi:hypothetical protein